MKGKKITIRCDGEARTHVAFTGLGYATLCGLDGHDPGINQITIPTPKGAKVDCEHCLMICEAVKGKPLTTAGGNDKVMTPLPLARQIVEYFGSTGKHLEPCRGTGNFVQALREAHCGPVHWCEIDEGHDFLTLTTNYDWIITNPPYSKFRPFLQHAMQLAPNVVFLAYVNAFFYVGRRDDMRAAGFRMVTILEVDTPPKPWPQAGFQLAAVHIRRGFGGKTDIRQATPIDWP